jgi:hypothetical protein
MLHQTKWTIDHVAQVLSARVIYESRMSLWISAVRLFRLVGHFDDDETSLHARGDLILNVFDRLPLASITMIISALAPRGRQRASNEQEKAKIKSRPSKPDSS